MAEQPNRRKTNLFGKLDMDKYITWFITIAAGGLVSSGVLYQKFDELINKVDKFEFRISESLERAQSLYTHDATQDQRLTEIERRLNNLDFKR